MSLVSSQKLSADNEAKLQKLINAIPSILAKTDNPDYDEIYGYRIAPDTADHVDPAARNEILLKFLVASEFKLETAEDRLKDTLNWRNTFRPLSAAYSEKFDEDLENMGVITDYPGNKDNFRVCTWNLYTNLKNPKKLFAKFGVGVDAEEAQLPGTMFLRWRVGIMERSLLLVDFTNPDNCKVAQVHDYNNVSMFRMDPGMKAATKEIIAIFGDNYPELLTKKYFVNVPLLMGWVFAFFKATGLMSAETLKKFEMLNHGDLSGAFGKENLPKEYNGGTGNEKVPTIFALAVTNAPVPAYGAIVMETIPVPVAKVTEKVEEAGVPDAEVPEETEGPEKSTKVPEAQPTETTEVVPVLEPEPTVRVDAEADAPAKV